MNNRYSNRLKIVAGLFFLLIFSAYYTSITFFPHAHRHANSTFVHSHPYKKDCNGNASHTHTQSEIELIAVLSLFISAGLALVAFTAIWGLGSFSRLFINSESSIVLGTYKELFNLRSPPSFVSI